MYSTSDAGLNVLLNVDMDRILKTRISFITLRLIFKSFISTMFSLKKHELDLQLFFCI